MRLYDCYVRFMVWLGAAPPTAFEHPSSRKEPSLMSHEETGMTEDDKLDNELLLKEYELCQKAAQSLETIIWQTSATIGIGSIGAFILMANHTEDKPLPWIATCVIGLLVSSASWVWFLMARRWWSIQQANFLRMRHIEERLPIFHRARYVNYLDDPDLLLKCNLPPNQQNEIRAQANERRYLKCLLPSHQKLGIQSVIWFIPFIITVAWGIYLVY